jgi:beta-phosphoglucomutase-like phosphatase (HAD superfamily)
MATMPNPLGVGRRLNLSVVRALLFDLDGVITRTATLHAAAWKRLLDDFLERWGAQNDREFAVSEPNVHEQLG